MSEPLVSVVCIAYNQEKYVGQALRGILAQKTNFPIEVIVNDDASTDKTAEVIRTFEPAFKGRMQALCRTENGWSRGIHPWFDATFPLVRGKYIALCEGDDYWLDPLKLAKQVAILEADPGIGAVHTDYLEYHQDKETFVHLRRETLRKKGKILGDLLRSNVNYLATGSLLIRTDRLREAVEAIRAMPRFAMGDFPLVLHVAAHSRIAYLNEPTCVYRVLGESASHSTDPSKRITFRRSTLEVIKTFARGLPDEEEIVRGALAFFYETLLMDCLRHPRLAERFLPELETAELPARMQCKRIFLKAFWKTPVADMLKTLLGALDVCRARARLEGLQVPSPEGVP